MNAIDNLIAALEAAKPELAADYRKFYARQVERLIEKTGGKVRRMSYNSPDYDLYQSCSQFIRYDGTSMASLAVGVNVSWLEKKAAEYADAVVDSHAAKLRKKLGDLTDVQVDRVTGAEFVIRGMLGDRRVRVEQTQIGKVSNRGTFFHQWPARIYVDGKFTPEVAFKKLAEVK